MALPSETYILQAWQDESLVLDYDAETQNLGGGELCYSFPVYARILVDDRCTSRMARGLQ